MSSNATASSKGGRTQTPTYLSAARRSWGPSWRQERLAAASRRRRGPVALRPRLSPGGLLSRSDATVGRWTRAVKQRSALAAPASRVVTCLLAYAHQRTGSDGPPPHHLRRPAGRQR